MFLTSLQRKPLRRDPFGHWDRDFEDLWRAFDTSTLENLRESTLAPRMDVVETDQALEIKADLPGIDEKDIHVTLDKNVLTIRGERKEEFESKKDAKVHRLERHYGEYVRQLTLPDTVDAAKITAQMANGVLKVTLPKKEAEIETRKTIEVKKG